jgi:hypothetical protein
LFFGVISNNHPVLGLSELFMDATKFIMERLSGNIFPASKNGNRPAKPAQI